MTKLEAVLTIQGDDLFASASAQAAIADYLDAKTPKSKSVATPTATKAKAPAKAKATAKMPVDADENIPF
jgi:hypothetical protein